jgi:mRNA deadenylase 3'-5' endonuclease subunit Ccr4
MSQMMIVMLLQISALHRRQQQQQQQKLQLIAAMTALQTWMLCLAALDMQQCSASYHCISRSTSTHTNSTFSGSSSGSGYLLQQQFTDQLRSYEFSTNYKTIKAVYRY